MSLRTGREYLEGLGDRRRVWLAGESVEHVVKHPALAECARTIARIYDLQHDPDARDVLTAETGGGRVPLAYVIPTSVDDLVRRRRMVEHVARMTGGMMGRLPDYVPTILLGLVAQKGLLARRNPQWAENVDRYFAHCSMRDLCLSHSFADRQLDRSRPSRELKHLRIVDRTADALVVRGFKTMATLAPLADECLVLTPPRAGLSPEQALFFALPIATPGLRLVCRRPLAGSADADHPLSGRFDEMDAWLAFDDVRVPLDRVFLAEDVETLQAAWRLLNVWAYHHILSRLAVKAELFIGVAGWISRLLGTIAFDAIRDDIAELVRYRETVRAFVRAAEADATTHAGVTAPNPRTLAVGHLYAAEHYPRLVQTLLLLGGQSTLMTPTAADEEGGLSGDLVAQLLSDGLASPAERVAAFRLAWDLTCTSFGARQLLFELFNARDFRRNRAAFIHAYDTTAFERVAQRLAGFDPGAPPAAAERMTDDGRR